jgi:flagellar motor switch protein FliN/FliY
MTSATATPDTTSESSEDYRPADFQSLEVEDQASAPKKNDLSLILDIPVTVAMEVGRTKLNIRELLRLGPGSVVELDRDAGAPMDIMVNGTLIAQGEVVVVNDKFGIRLTDVVSMSERVKRLNRRAE